MKFKEIKPGMVIHCPKEEDARALLEHLTEMGYEVSDAIKTNAYRTYKEKVCFYISPTEDVSYGDIDFYAHDEDFRESESNLIITEFSDLIEPEMLSGKEVIEWLDKYSREIESMPELFPNCKTITDVVEWYTPECIMEKMVWYEKHKKDNADSPINSPINLGTDSPMTAKEILEWFRKAETKDFEKLFSCGVIEEIFDYHTNDEIVRIISAYEAAKKEKPVEVECGYYCTIYECGDNCEFTKSVAEYTLWNVTEESAKADVTDKTKDYVSKTGKQVMANIEFVCRVVKEGE